MINSQVQNKHLLRKQQYSIVQPYNTLNKQFQFLKKSCPFNIELSNYSAKSIQSNYTNYTIRQYNPKINKINALYKVTRRYIYRAFMNRITSYVIKRIEKQIRETKIIKDQQTNNKKAEKLTYLTLMNKSNPNQQQIFMKQFFNHCATRIQCNFRRYIISKRHKIVLQKTKSIKQILIAYIKGWKVRKILKSKKLLNIKLYIRELNIKITSSIENLQLDKKLNYLNKQLNLNIELFNQQFDYLYKSGGWVFQCNLGLDTSILKNNNKKQINTNFQNNQFITNQILIHHNSKQNKLKSSKKVSKQSVIRDHQLIEQQIQSTNNINQNQRVIKSKGVYQIVGYQQYNNNTQINHKQIRIQQQNKIQKIKQNKLSKKPKYDPRKAVQQQKKRKKQFKLLNQKQKKQNKQSKTILGSSIHNLSDPDSSDFLKVSKIITSTIFNEKQKSIKKNEEEIFKIQEKISKIANSDSKKISKLLEEKKYRTHSKELILQKRQESQEDPENGQIYLSEKRKIRYQKMAKNMENFLKKIEQQASIKKITYRSIQELQFSYNSQYKARYSKLFLKFANLEYKRSQLYQNIEEKIPIIYNYSLFQKSVSNIDDKKYEVVRVKLQRKYKNLIDFFQKQDQFEFRYFQ